MKNCLFVYLSFFVFIFSSCSNTAVGELETIKTYSTISVTASELIDHVSFVKLETTSGNLIGQVSKLLFTDSLIIVVDKAISRSIYVFGLDGHYIRKIGTFGKGPTEYNDICDVTLSFDKTKLHVLSVRKLTTYTLDGTYVSNQKVKSICHLIEYVDKNTLATFNYSGRFDSKKINERNLIQVVDKEFKSVYSAISSSFQSSDMLMAYDFPLVNVNGKIFLLPDISDTIYQVTDKAVTPRYYVKTEDKKPNANEIINASKRKSENFSSRFNGGFYQINNTIILPLIFSSTPLIFYNTLSKKSYSYDAYKEYKTNPFLDFVINIKTQYKSTLVSTVFPAKLLSQKERFYKFCDKKMIDSLLENMTEDDNPVLLFYHINNKEPQ